MKPLLANKPYEITNAMKDIATALDRYLPHSEVWEILHDAWQKLDNLFGK